MTESLELKRFYDRFASDYDHQRFASAYHRDVAAREEAFVAARVPAGGRVLEIGCGTGRFTRHLVARADRVVAVDLSREMLGIVQDKNPDAGNLELVHASLFDLPGRIEGPFDAVISMRLIPHLDDQVGALRVIRSLLRPGGTAIVDFWNRWSFIGLARILLRRTSRAVIHYRTPGNAHALLVESGLAPGATLAWGYPRVGRYSLDRAGAALVPAWAYSTTFHALAG